MTWLKASKFLWSEKNSHIQSLVVRRVARISQKKANWFIDNNSLHVSFAIIYLVDAEIGWPPNSHNVKISSFCDSAATPSNFHGKQALSCFTIVINFVNFGPYTAMNDTVEQFGSVNSGVSRNWQTDLSNYEQHFSETHL